MEKEVGGGGEGVIVVYGCPGSGKSTFSEQLLEVLERRTLLVCLDNVEEYFYHNETLDIPSQPILESVSFTQLSSLPSTKSHAFSPQVWKKSRDFVKSNIDRFKDVCDILIVEDDFYLKSLRKPYRQYAALHQIRYLEIYMDTPRERCLELNQQRGVTVPQSIIQQKYQKLEITGTRLQINQRNVDSNWVYSRFIIPPPIDKVQPILQIHPHQLNPLEQTQQLIRKQISQIIQHLKEYNTTGSDRIKQVSFALSNLKKSYDLKNGIDGFKEIVQKYLEEQ